MNFKEVVVEGYEEGQKMSTKFFEEGAISVSIVIQGTKRIVTGSFKNCRFCLTLIPHDKIYCSLHE